MGTCTTSKGAQNPNVFKIKLQRKSPQNASSYRRASSQIGRPRARHYEPRRYYMDDRGRMYVAVTTTTKNRPFTNDRIVLCEDSDVTAKPTSLPSRRLLHPTAISWINGVIIAAKPPICISRRTWRQCSRHGDPQRRLGRPARWAIQHEIWI